MSRRRRQEEEEEEEEAMAQDPSGALNRPFFTKSLPHSTSLSID
jgi:hypothetical protein